MELMCVKGIDNSLRPASPSDAEYLNQLKIGQPVKLRATKSKERSLQHHRLFFGGLLRFAFDYWQPAGGLITANERAVVDWVAKQLDALTGGKGVIVNASREALDLLSKKRSEKVHVVEKDIDSFRNWLTIEAGYYEVHETPAGVIKKPKSISFSNMNQDEFNAFYKSCFNVCWNMILCDKFKNKQEVEDAINQLLALGS